MLTRILSLADAFDAMTNSRPYLNSLSIATVKEIPEQEAGRQFDKELTLILLAMLEKDELKMHDENDPPEAHFN